MKALKIPNHNKKLDCESFIHIGIPPTDGFSYNQLPIKVMVEKSTDEVFEAEWIEKLIYPVNEVPEFFSQLSHNMSSSQLAEYFSERQGLKPDAKVCVYLYKKV